MIEKIILEYLTKELDVPVYAEHPEKPPETYVVFEKTGSGKTEHIKTATLALQSFAASMLETMELNEKVKAAMDDAAQLPEISRSELNSDYNYTDEETHRYRYQAVYNLVHY